MLFFLTEFIKTACHAVTKGLCTLLPVDADLIDRFLSFSLPLNESRSSFSILFPAFLRIGVLISVILLTKEALSPISFRDSTVSLRKEAGKNILPVACTFLPWMILRMLLPSQDDPVLPLRAVFLILSGVLFLLLIRILPKERILGTNGGDSLPPLTDASAASVTLRQSLILGAALGASAVLPGLDAPSALLLGGMAVGLSASASFAYSVRIAVPMLLFEIISSFFRAETMMNFEECLFAVVGGVAAFFTVRIVASFFYAFSARLLEPTGWYRVFLGLSLMILFILMSMIQNRPA